MKCIILGSPIGVAELHKDMPEGVTIKDTGSTYREFDSEGFSLSMIVVTFAANVSASVVAAILYDSIKKRSRKATERISINHEMIRF